MAATAQAVQKAAAVLKAGVPQVALRKIDETGTKGFLLWLSTRQPWLYNRVKNKISLPVSGLGLAVEAATTGTASSSPSFVESLKSLLTTGAQVYLTKEQLDQQKKILDLQLQRAQQGLSPLDLDPAVFGLPGPSVNFGVAPDVKKLLIWGGLGAAALFLVTRFLK